MIALDLNPHQNYLLELKMAAFKFLSYENMLEFIGVRKSGKRLVYYDSIKYSMSVNARIFWDSKISKVKKGIVHSGRYENYMKLLRDCIRVFVSKRTIRKFFDSDDINQRKRLFEKKWNTWRWSFSPKSS